MLKVILLTQSDVSSPGKKNKLRVYYLSWLRNKILHNDPEVEKKQGWTTVGDLEGCVHYKVGGSHSHSLLDSDTFMGTNKNEAKMFIHSFIKHLSTSQEYIEAWAHILNDADITLGKKKHHQSNLYYRLQIKTRVNYIEKHTKNAFIQKSKQNRENENTNINTGYKKS